MKNVLIALVAMACACGSKAAGSSGSSSASAPPSSAADLAASIPDDPKAAADMARPLALPFCQKPIGEIADADFPHFKGLVGMFRSPRYLDRKKPADKEFPFHGRAGFFIDDADKGSIVLVVTSKNSDPCKAEVGRSTNGKMDEPAAVFEFEETPMPGSYVATFNDQMPKEKYKHVLPKRGYPLIDKDKQPTDYTFMEGEVMFKITKYETGKTLEGEVMACGDPYVYATEGEQRAKEVARVKEFLIGTFTATVCSPP